MKGQGVISVGQTGALEDQWKQTDYAARVILSVPGSSANVGPGFDTLGLALALYTRFTFLLVEKESDPLPLVSITGGADPAWGETTRFLEIILDKACESSRSVKEIRNRLRLVIDSDVPVGKGLGSSASLVDGALYAAQKLAGEKPDMTKVLEIATAIEGHPDNVSASLLGGFTLCAYDKQKGNVVAQKLAWPSQWCPLLVVPERPVSTSKARKILPKMVSRADTIFNMQHVALLVAAVARQDDELLKVALHDKIHQDDRAELVPELNALKKLLRNETSLGCVLSGAGSSVLVLAHEREKASVKARVESWSKKANAKILDLNVDQDGLQELDG